METLTLNQITTLLKSPDSRTLSRSNILFRKFVAGIILFASDIILISISLIVSLILRNLLWPGEVLAPNNVSVLPFLIALFPITYYLRGLYPGFGTDVIDELRKLTYSTTIVYAFLATLSYMIKDSLEFSRIAFILSWGLSLILIPLGRAGVRKLFGAKSWWGVPVLIIGAGNAGEKVIKSLQKHSQIGLVPYLAVDDDIERWGYINNVPVVGGLEIIPELSSKLNIEQAIIAMPNVNKKRQQEIISLYSRYFNSTTFIPDLYGIESLWVSTKDFGGIIGLEVQQRLLKKSSLMKKRIFDIVLASTLSIIASPLLLLISIMIKLDSKGKIFFRQERMGIRDSRFSIVKFRTMHIDAEDRLTDLLKQNDDLRAEYEVFHKMKNDPRLTRVGKLLRKFSLDELPQFFNVIKGEMSLIGPRAYMPWEKYKMNGHEEMILKVKPGISGLWQVTDRNQSSFEERNSTDVYYIRNWSMFLDLYILARTIGVVLSGKGAY